MGRKRAAPPGSRGRIDVLADLASPYRNVTTAAVLDELLQQDLRDAATAGDWLEEQRLDGLAEIGLLGLWLERLGAGAHHCGEVTVAVACEVLHATALLDDRAGLAGDAGLRADPSRHRLASARCGQVGAGWFRTSP